MSSHGFGLHSGYCHGLLRQWQSTNTEVTSKNLMYPIFLTSDPKARQNIDSMPNVKRWGLNTIESHIGPLVDIGLTSVLLFGVPDDSVKDENGTGADTESKSPVIPVIKLLRKSFPDLLIACDVCLCGYTSHGHCGILNEDGTIDNDRSVKRLAEISVQYATAGCQVIAPSDMMDGRVLAIKQALKDAGFLRTVAVLSYAAKFSSCFYGPFRDAAASAPSFGNRKAYQLPGGSSGLAVRAVDRDVAEGADMLMVKPAMAYLDVIYRVKQKYPDFPVFAYQVSGEYSMLIAGSDGGLFDLDTALDEVMTSLRRAGADVIITYFTPNILERLSNY